SIRDAQHLTIDDSTTLHVDKCKLQTKQSVVNLQTLRKNRTIERVTQWIQQGAKFEESVTFVLGTNNLTGEYYKHALDKVETLQNTFLDTELTMEMVSPSLRTKTFHIKESDKQESLQLLNQVSQLTSEKSLRDIQLNERGQLIK
ncbi:unnamed protein product, partial [Didymodactylos carnosus]